MHTLFHTSYLFDFMDRPGVFPNFERRVPAARGAEFYVSAVSIWEMRLKYGARHPSGACKSRFSPEDVIDALADQDVTFQPTTMLRAARGLRIPLGHKGPLDELLLVQAQEESLRLLSVDRRLVGHPLAVAIRELG